MTEHGPLALLVTCVFVEPVQSNVQAAPAPPPEAQASMQLAGLKAQVASGKGIFLAAQQKVFCAVVTAVPHWHPAVFGPEAKVFVQAVPVPPPPVAQASMQLAGLVLQVISGKGRFLAAQQ